MWQPGCWPAWHRGEEKMGASTLFCTGHSWGSQTQLPALLMRVAQGIPLRGRAVQGPCMQRVPPQDWPTGVLSYVCREASWKQSNNGFMSNRASVMFKAWSTFPPIPQQAASSLPPPFGSPVVEGCGSSIAAGLQGTTYWKRCCCKQDGCWRKVVVMGGAGGVNRGTSTDSGPEAGFQGTSSDPLGRSVEEDKSTLRGMKPSCRMA